ncbi:MAG TPA: hypothetical protein DCW74_02240 [Alteromonas australica]|jgi:cob(I)alamin adenosyltransferase|uniref:Uncharacterized protein n=1 Tax=Alteromonas australica TaxID=589873 RepID=A0A350NZR9_9ALTE|nr:MULTISPECIES: hypothetical protein [Alteromonas]MBU34601.1 hypothetical protein [Alteromonas sp.]QPL49512.1 hypothetical protein IUA53_17015 [Alteromonas sp. B31-7]HAU27577.1 hypothetical protein [Alteromonas australica]HAW74536.1 hypothetical protein [Alteromonas australica]HBU52882.1 hypothetical protein [Alteromonas australica]|tara:strand:- start:548 stop:727 length:180 start_codon:yes stop_codon:yes gene_type:complete
MDDDLRSLQEKLFRVSAVLSQRAVHRDNVSALCEDIKHLIETLERAAQCSHSSTAAKPQ